MFLTFDRLPRSMIAFITVPNETPLRASTNAVLYPTGYNTFEAVFQGSKKCSLPAQLVSALSCMDCNKNQRDIEHVGCHFRLISTRTLQIHSDAALTRAA